MRVAANPYSRNLIVFSLFSYSRKNSIVLRTQLSVRVHAVIVGGKKKSTKEKMGEKMIHFTEKAADDKRKYGERKSTIGKMRRGNGGDKADGATINRAKCNGKCSKDYKEAAQLRRTGVEKSPLLPQTNLPDLQLKRAREPKWLESPALEVKDLCEFLGLDSRPNQTKLSKQIVRCGIWGKPFSCIE
ncbi:hypothetical protein J437_LFUL017644 [Ladona fulva]|uniref:Uncharacterized protein n=1 Tax=Ladona fulva TaxID=123851 RepID=A0A8K0KNC2_LADFU|nr:hypothetical protein J437_LFUL017644 [Ladona fulva]